MKRTVEKSGVELREWNVKAEVWMESGEESEVESGMESGECSGR